jgi:protein-S-isoprenylcysteine O-methyltransferase Ste14
MNRAAAAIGSLVWLLLAPGVVAGLIPWWLTDGDTDGSSGAWLPLRALGAVLILAGAAALLHAFARFVLDGLGTPAPVAAPQELVVTGLYRHVRNPMYLAVLALVVGEAMLLVRPVLLGYAVVVALITIGFVKGYEEPTLHHRFGAAYDAYRAAVPAWWPRRRAWTPDPR